MTETLVVAGVQTHNRVGDLEGNARQIREAMRWAEGAGADVLVLPEMCLTGYPIQDLAYRRQFVAEAREALQELAAESGPVATLVGTTDRIETQRSWDTRSRDVAIGQAVLWNGEIRGVYHKCLLPTYDVFDEARTFAAGRRPGAVWRIGSAVAGICICEDLWSSDGPPEAQAAAGAQVLLVPNGSPFYRDKPQVRRDRVRAVARRTGLPAVYVNCVGGHDDLVFDGGSFVVDADGNELFAGAQFCEDRFCLAVPLAPPAPSAAAITVHARRDHSVRHPAPPTDTPLMSGLEQVWWAICLGLSDFVEANGFEGVAVALSGGVDSAVCLLAAAEAVGAQRVLAVAMPASPEQSEEAEDARRLAERAGTSFECRDLEGELIVDPEHMGDTPEAVARARQDAEARTRASVLASLGTSRGLLPISTVNKTELALGAVSLFGETAGGYAPLRDCPKTLVYALARFLQERDGLIGERTMERRASLRRGAGADLPAFGELDPIVEQYLSGDAELDEIVAGGADPRLARGVLQLIDDAEFKRRLAPIGPKITERAFGQDRRMPVSNRWRPYQRQEEALVADSHEVDRWEAGDAFIG